MNNTSKKLQRGHGSHIKWRFYDWARRQETPWTLKQASYRIGVTTRTIKNYITQLIEDGAQFRMTKQTGKNKPILYELIKPQTLAVLGED